MRYNDELYFLLGVYVGLQLGLEEIGIQNVPGDVFSRIIARRNSIMDFLESSFSSRIIAEALGEGLESLNLDVV